MKRRADVLKLSTRPSVLLPSIALLISLSGLGCERSGSDGGEVRKYGPAPKDSYDPKLGRYGGTYVFSSFGEGLKSFNPITAGETSTTDYTQRIFEPLLRQDVWTMEVGPWLAESWEHSDDNLVWTIHLRKDVTFNNGMPLTADDVVFTFETMYDESITCSARDLLTVDGKKWKVEKLDAHTVRFTLPTVYALFLDRIGSPDIGIVCKAACEPAVKAGTFNSFMGAEAKPEEVVGTGPFMLDRYVPGQRLYLKRNPRYWRKDAKGQPLPYLDGIVVLWSQTIDGMMLQFKAGETDRYGLRGTDYPILKPLEAKGDFRINELATDFSKTFLTFNQNTGKNPKTGEPYVAPHKLKWFRDTTFRQAVSHSIDRQGIINTVYNGLAAPAYGPLNDSVEYYYNPAVRPYEYDLGKATRMLAGLGLKDRDGDRFLEDESGHVVEFTLMTNAGNDQREKTSEIVRKDLERLGIRVSLKFIEFNTLISKLDETYDWEAVVMGLTGSPEPYDGANVWKSSGRVAMWFPKQKSPSTPWEARIDAIFAQAIKEPDRAKRKELFDEWQMIVNEQQPFIYTVSQRMMHGFKNKFENVYCTPIAGALRQWCDWNLDEMFIKEGYSLE